MEDFATKRIQALDACDKVINGIEDGTITISSALLQCMKIARLVNDIDAMEWLNCELGGYPRNNEGFLTASAWDIAVQHGRSYVDKTEKKTYVFTDLAAELENVITNSRSALNNFSTQGFSVSGEYAISATSRMTENVNHATNNLLNASKRNEQRLSILKAQFYGYAVKWQIELRFGKTAKKIFEEYQERVGLFFSELPTTTLQKLSAIEDLMEDGNPERYSQVLTSCRRLWEDVAQVLFEEVLPDHKEKIFKTKTGKEIDVSGDHYNNKISAAIETLQERAAKNTLVGSEIIYLIDWMEQINKLQSSGVHSEVTRDQAMRCIIHTYIALGDILKLRDDVS
ncbi:MAG: hypothetical protein IJE94_06940 [Oscillospiraceae bacterium]|nr:hypothetical protein [Oscillospiraceae bacterium]